MMMMTYDDNVFVWSWHSHNFIIFIHNIFFIIFLHYFFYCIYEISLQMIIIIRLCWTIYIVVIIINIYVIFCFIFIVIIINNISIIIITLLLVHSMYHQLLLCMNHLHHSYMRIISIITTIWYIDHHLYHHHW